MTDIYQSTCRTYTNKAKTKIAREQITEWLYEFAPTHFISIQFPTNQRSKYMDKSIYRLKAVMKTFEKALNIRHWKRKHLLFIAFAENHKSEWHFHIYLKNDRYTDKEISQATDTTINKFKFSSDVFNIKPIIYTPYWVYFYGNKEITVDKNYHFTRDRIFLSGELFNLPMNTSGLIPEWLKPDTLTKYKLE